MLTNSSQNRTEISNEGMGGPKIKVIGGKDKGCAKHISKSFVLRF